MSEQVKSLVKSMAVLEFLSHHPDGVALHEIAQQTGINKTSAYRMLSTFEALGYVAQHSASKNYRLTLKLLHIGHSALSSDVLATTRPKLNELVKDLNETINFISREGDKIVFRDKLEPQHSPFRTRTFVGMYSEMYCTAAGKVFLAFSTQEDQENYWQRNVGLIQKLTDNTIVNKTHFLNELKKIREQGYAIDNEENEAGISCTAVPIFDRSGSPAYAVSLSTLTPRLRNFGPDNLANKIKQTTEKIAQELFKQ
ncbi:IclR family transcriptional regulator [Vibrio gazogenes]|uniref:Transcriptional regulator, IclR family n=1 Tax=Vibrio gazogenes DSM 21264 = NBRC 103151 TaxID=1123492 RepID=A0A1M5CIJ1_VIBGA|nr:IclR family transcriptional regulator [Vibrio gazogenes]USP14242.1 IclR family transcriptional regulator [Vibrio gazogenes]SHF54574.1 transcriptional regulator, IclR family [Vibrio gazogenes DSM 21264] [Vibrio gazogenes DSM 21264 = NBRC 103151]SJN53765.1 HTH-type transcriptional regulator YiaJ [Vibrio gazogenes]